MAHFKSYRQGHAEAVLTLALVVWVILSMLGYL
jgi:hypothetical protein